MEKITKKQLDDLIKKYKNTFYIIGVNGAILKTMTCAGFICVSEKEAKEFYDSIKNDNAENKSELTLIALGNLKSANDLSFLFDNDTKNINIVNYGIFEKEELLNTDIDNINYILKRVDGFLDNDKLYTIINDDDFSMFSPTKEVKQYIFSNKKDAEEWLLQYNTTGLNLVASDIYMSIIGRDMDVSTFETCVFDGRYCSSQDISEAFKIAFNKNAIDAEKVRDIFVTNGFFVLSAGDEINCNVKDMETALFFTSKEKAEKFQEDYKMYSSNIFKLRQVEFINEFKFYCQGTDYVSIDAEIHCSVEDFFKGIQLGTN